MDNPLKYVLIVVCHEPLRSASVFRAELVATSMPAALVEAEGHIAGLRQSYHDVDSAKILAVVEEVTIDVDGTKAEAERQKKLDIFNKLKAELNL